YSAKSWFFFFQAEDGIRDIHVTGVQTCSLPIFTNGYDVENIEKQPLDQRFTLAHIGSFLSERNPRILWKALSEIIRESKEFRNRSEERRVVNECNECVCPYRCIHQYKNHVSDH